jgi:hypothetical protein
VLEVPKDLVNKRVKRFSRIRGNAIRSLRSEVLLQRVNEGVKQARLVCEVVKEQALGHAGLAGDVLHAGSVVAVRTEQVERGPQNAVGFEI